MYVVQVMANCEAVAVDSRGMNTGSLIVGRYDTVEADYAVAGRSELQLWMLRKPVVAIPSMDVHPLRLYTSFIAKDPEDKKKRGAYIDNKPIHQPKYALAVTVHGGYAVPNAKTVRVEDGICAKWLHIVNMRKPRRPYDTSRHSIDPRWMWPFHEARKGIIKT
jgi:hypothetical protein